MKKCIAILLSVAMVIGMFVGCGSEKTATVDPEATGAQATQSETTAVYNAPEEFRNTDIYPLEGEHSFTMATTLEKSDEYPIYEEWMEVTGIDIDFEIVSKEQIPLLVAGGSSTMPDLIFTKKEWADLTIDQINEYGKSGAIINYKDYLDRMPNLSAAIAADPDILCYAADEEGNFYTLPRLAVALTQSGPAFYIRSDHMNKAGWTETPTTIDEFTQLLRDFEKTFSPEDPDYIPFTVLEPSWISYTGWLSQALFAPFGDLLEIGLTTTNNNTEVAAGFASEQYKRFVSYLNGLYEEGLLDNDCFTTNAEYMKTFMADGHTSVNSTMVYMSASNFESGNFDIIMPTPLLSEYRSEPQYLLPDGYNYWVSLINPECEDLDAVLAFLDSLYAPEDNPLDEEGTMWAVCFWLGKLNQDWKWLEEGVSYQILMPEGYNNRNEYMAGKYYEGCLYANFPYIQYDEFGNVKFKPVQVQKNLYPYGVQITRTGWLDLTEDEYDIYVDAWADINTYVTQMHAAFITGSVDVEAEWDNYIQKLDDMGLQDVLDVYQAALDRYNA